MEKYHIAVVEDEPLFAKQLEEYIRRYERERDKKINITFFTDGEDIVENYSGDYDVILMDIQMQFMDGMTAAQKIRGLDHEVIIMFITNRLDYAVRGYEVDAMDYVVKPVEYFAFSQKLDKAFDRMKKPDEVYVSVVTEDGVWKLKTSEIYYIESQGHYARYRTVRGDFVSRAALKSLDAELRGYGFFRCSKGFLVNMANVDGLSGGECIVCGEKIPVSRGVRKEFMELLMRYMSMN